MFHRTTTPFGPTIQIDHTYPRLSVVEEVDTPSTTTFLAPINLQKSRPVSEVTEIFDSETEEFHGDETSEILDDRSEVQGEDLIESEEEVSEFEEDSHEPVHYYPDQGRHSHGTISTLEEVSTPRTLSRARFDVRVDSKPVEGPRGPHLFRASHPSAHSSLDFALQLSPLVSMKEELRSEIVHGPPSTLDATPISPGPDVGALRIEPLNDEEVAWDVSEPRSWSPQQVAIWMYNLGMDAETVEKFELHDITGNLLLDLQFSDLKELGIESFGKRHSVWNHICSLRGEEGRPPQAPTPFQDIDEPISHIEQAWLKKGSHIKLHLTDDCRTPITPGGGRRRRRKVRRHEDDTILPAESISIVAIEQLIPKPHKCPKGENCSKYRKQQRLLRKLHDEHGFPISPEQGGKFFIAGDPGNAMRAPKIVENVHFSAPEMSPSIVGPSVVASSDVLGPGDMPFVGLQEDTLRQLEERDPQDNVRNFLTLQDIEPPSMFLPEPDEEVMPPDELDSFPHFQTPPRATPRASLQRLPRLEIPVTSSSHSVQPSHPMRNSDITAYRTAFEDTFSPCVTALASPTQEVFRFGTPATDMDIPSTSVPLGPIARETSQSVPPDMQYRDPVPRNQSRLASRRPSFALPMVAEEESISSAVQPTFPESVSQEAPMPGSLGHMPRPSQDSRVSSTGSVQSYQTASLADTTTNITVPSSAFPGSNAARPDHMKIRSMSLPVNELHAPSTRYPGVNHAGWMKKRKTKLLRHEWQKAHFRLTGNELAMHSTDAPTAKPLESLNIDNYTVACSSISSNKLAAKLKAFKLGVSSSNSSSSGPANIVRPTSSLSTSTASSHNHNSSEAANNSVKTKDLGPLDTPFSFQLVPALNAVAESGAGDNNNMSALRRAVAGAKSYHFAVKTRDERMDWMREIMLAKALRAKGQGFEVELNGAVV